MSLQEVSAKLEGLSGITNTSADVIDQDIALLRHDGMSMSIDETRRWRVDAAIPGFALRLTKAEASMVWAWSVAYASSDRPVAAGVSPAALGAAVRTLQAGLRRFHPGSEVMRAVDGTTPRPDIVTGCEREHRLQASELTGEARLVYRRLSVVDLIESRKALNTSQLAAALYVSRRTVHDDLNVLRGSGLAIRFCRRGQEFHAQGLNAFLARHLTLPVAAALLVLLKPAVERHDDDDADPSNVASEKLAKSIQLIFARQAADLQELVASYGNRQPTQ